MKDRIKQSRQKVRETLFLPACLPLLFIKVNKQLRLF